MPPRYAVPGQFDRPGPYGIVKPGHIGLARFLR